MKILSVLMVFGMFILMGCTSSEKLVRLQADEFEKKLTTVKLAQLIDVRTPEEFSTGHIKSAKNINYYDPDFKKHLQALDKSDPVFIYCKSGNRSSKAAKIFEQEGFPLIYELQGGILSWEKDNVLTFNE